MQFSHDIEKLKIKPNDSSFEKTLIYLGENETKMRHGSGEFKDLRIEMEFCINL